MDTPWRIQALTLAGRVIMENGGETYRAEDTVMRMAQALGLSEPEAFCVPSGLFFSFTDESGQRQTSVCRIYHRSIHLARVDGVNQISRRLSEGTLAPEALLSELRQVAALEKETSPWQAPLFSFITAAGFAMMFAGGPWDMLIGGLCAALPPLLHKLLNKEGESGLASLLLGSCLCTLLPLLFHQLTGLGLPESMIAGALMPLVPGLSMTNAVQDVLRGDMLSGVAHGAKAVLTAAMIAGGALMGAHLMNLMGGLWL